MSHYAHSVNEMINLIRKDAYMKSVFFLYTEWKGVIALSNYKRYKVKKHGARDCKPVYTFCVQTVYIYIYTHTYIYTHNYTHFPVYKEKLVVACCTCMGKLWKYIYIY